MNSSVNNVCGVSKPSNDQEIEDMTCLEDKIEHILNQYDYQKGSLISILLEIQTEYNYLPKKALIQVADKLGVRLIDVYSVATFYKVFSLKPRGKHIISVCLGTACHVRGGGKIVEEIERELNIKDGETTEDMQFTLESVRCLGACALGPVIVIDGEYYGQMTSKKVGKVLKQYSSKEENT